MSPGDPDLEPRRRRRVLRAIAIGVLVLVLLPVWALETNPPARSEPPWDSPRTRELARRACFDCHSNETSWPWYDRLPPASWLVTYHVLSGRDDLNLSEWKPGTGGDKLARKAAREVRSKDMPPSSYLWIHPSNGLTDAEREELAKGLEATLR